MGYGRENWNEWVTRKNCRADRTFRLGAYHAPQHTFLDFSFLKTLPVGQVSPRQLLLVYVPPN